MERPSWKSPEECRREFVFFTRMHSKNLHPWQIQKLCRIFNFRHYKLFAMFNNYKFRVVVLFPTSGSTNPPLSSIRFIEHMSICSFAARSCGALRGGPCECAFWSRECLIPLYGLHHIPGIVCYVECRQLSALLCKLNVVICNCIQPMNIQSTDSFFLNHNKHIYFYIYIYIHWISLVSQRSHYVEAMASS